MKLLRNDGRARRRSGPRKKPRLVAWKTLLNDPALRTDKGEDHLRVHLQDDRLLVPHQCAQGPNMLKSHAKANLGSEVENGVNKDEMGRVATTVIVMLTNTVTEIGSGTVGGTVVMCGTRKAAETISDIMNDVQIHLVPEETDDIIPDCRHDVGAICITLSDFV